MKYFVVMLVIWCYNVYIDIRGDVVMNINSNDYNIDNDLEISDIDSQNVLDIFQLQDGIYAFGCITCKHNDICKVYLYVERSNEVTSNLLQKEFPLTKMENAKAYFNKLKELVKSKDLFKILKYVNEGL